MEYSYKKIFTMIALIAVVACIAIGVSYIQRPHPDSSFQAISPAVSNVLDANPADAAAKAQVFLASTDRNDPYYTWGSVVLAESAFRAATTSAGMVAAVRMMQENVANARTPQLQAAELNALVGVLFEANNRSAYDQAFKEEPFRSLLDTKSARTSMTNLIEYSIRIYPTPDAYLLLARQQADIIIGALKPASTALASSTTETKSSLATRAAQIAGYIGQADALEPQGATFDRSSPYATTISPLRNYWKGYALGAAALVDPMYLPDAEKDFQLAIDAHQIVKDSNGNGYPVLEQIATRAHFTYARRLYAAGGDTRATDVRTQLVALVAAITRSPNMYAYYYMLFDSAKNSPQVTGANRDRNQNYHAYVEFSALASVSPELKTFLNSRGWNL